MRAPAFQFYPSDFLTGTDEMEPDEVGLYIRLLSYQWLRPEGGLPNDQKKLVNLCRCRASAIPDAVMRKFTAGEDGLLRNGRLEAERQKQQKYREGQAEFAKKRWEKPPVKPPPIKSDSPHHQFIALWCDRFKAVHGHDYAMDGGRDGKGAKALLGSTKLPPDQLVALAESAWRKPDQFNCRIAVTIHGFASKFNEVRAELKNGHHGKTVGTATPSNASF